jgi:hypothetical protein
MCETIKLVYITVSGLQLQQWEQQNVIILTHKIELMKDTISVIAVLWKWNVEMFVTGKFTTG